MATWDFDGYWNAVLGAERTPGRVIGEFELEPADRRGLDEWLGHAEVEAWRVGGEGGDLPEEWAVHHARALAALCAVEAA